MTIFSAGEGVLYAHGQAESAITDRTGKLLNQRWVDTEIHKAI